MSAELELFALRRFATNWKFVGPTQQGPDFQVLIKPGIVAFYSCLMFDERGV